MDYPTEQVTNNLTALTNTLTELRTATTNNQQVTAHLDRLIHNIKTIDKQIPHK